MIDQITTTETSLLRSADGTLWRPEDRPCPVCNSKSFKTIGARGGLAHREGKGVKTNIVQCVTCKVLYSKPTLIPLTNPYAAETADEYFAIHDSNQKIANGEAIAAEAESILKRTGRMLELGCGRGESLVGAARRGWEVHGVEMTEGFARIATANRINVEQATIADCKALEKGERFEVILLGAVLEHLYAPAETLLRACHALSPGGLLFIDVPNELSLAARVGNFYMRLRGRDWAINLSPTFPPFHVVGFSPASLKHALAGAGLDVYRMQSVKYSNALKSGEKVARKLEQAMMGAVQAVGARIGMGDGIVCWAIRR
jgi:2-polyprenyl-3-methyl-5-hydroxy-6-metoxy-1,4-benzoquinol methylase